MEQPKEAALALKGLASGVTKDTLMAMFRTYGPVQRIALAGQGTAHVVFASRRSADRAAIATNGARVGGQAITVSKVGKFEKSARPCRSFQQGKCRKGDECKYLHVGEAGAAVKPAAATVPKVQTTPKADGPRPCQFFAMGQCRRGEDCQFLHETPAVAKKAAPAAKKTPAAKAKTEKKAKNQQSGQGRTCVECEQADSAVWQCVQCENALYCDDCNAAVHRPKVLRSHERTKLPPVVTKPKNPTCEECEKNESTVQCEDCGVPYCAACDSSVHQFKSLRSHKRTGLTSDEKPAKAAPVKKTETKAKPAAPVTAYIDSVPKFDLLSESESSEDEESDNEDAEPAVAPHAVTTTTEDSESEDVEMESAPAAPISYVNSVPKFELSSDSESSDDEDEKPAPIKKAPVNTELSSESESDDEDDKPAPLKTTPAPRAKAPVPVDVSSESSDDDFEDERPATPASAKPAPAKKIEAKPATVTVSSESSSESESDDDDEKPVVKAAPVAAKKRPAPSASSSDSDSSSDDEDEKPVAKQPRVTTTPARSSSNPPPPPPRRGQPERKPGISSGSSHTLVKKIEEYYESDNTEVMHLDPNLNGFERLLAHDCAERLGLQHVSVGLGLERHITISRKV
ncbi:hypothetical protein Poli38472_001351 [Pythium oligandrum]|uniref:Uncharacterized protein n=1 Tax=Pythium oligandrum TaxID=41045 RepID=A0A8K1FMB9_PYTOL|nr:hypothetical protein Poli38472_001351 [Pythium oligandrum]|eukprot:TMW69195.1 hypothetical protein Poli38472_001351 [Pythium oligandrum]